MSIVGGGGSFLSTPFDFSTQFPCDKCPFNKKIKKTTNTQNTREKTIRMQNSLLSFHHTIPSSPSHPSPKFVIVYAIQYGWSKI